MLPLPKHNWLMSARWESDTSHCLMPCPQATEAQARTIAIRWAAESIARAREMGLPYREIHIGIRALDTDPLV